MFIYVGKGWVIITVREKTVEGVEELAYSKRLTIEFVNGLMNPSGKAGRDATYAGLRLSPRTSTNTYSKHTKIKI